MLKVLHSADWHVRDKDIAEIEKCLNFLSAKAQEVDLVVIAGDVFDSRDIRLDSRSAKLVVKTVSELADICPVAIVLGTASHDGTAAEVLRYAKGKHYVRVSSVPEQIYLKQGELYPAPGIASIRPAAILSMVPQPTKQFFNQGDIQTSNEAIAYGMAGLFAGFGAQAAEFPRVPHLLVGHWNVSGSKLSTGQVLTGQEIDISVDQMSLTNAGAHLLGHIHMMQQLGDRTFYSGSLYPLTWAETEAKGFHIHEFDCDELYKSTFIKTPCRKLVRFAVDLATEDIVFLRNHIIHHISTTDVKEAFVRVDITAWQDEAGMIDKEDIVREYLSYGAKEIDIRINAVPRETIRATAVLEAETLSDEFAEMAKLRNEEIDPEILTMAEQLERDPAEEILKKLAEAA